MDGQLKTSPIGDRGHAPAAAPQSWARGSLITVSVERLRAPRYDSEL